MLKGNSNERSFVFELPNDEASLIPVASCLLVKASNPEALKDAKGNPVIRPYTPISPPDQAGELTLLIKRYEQGVMSKHVHSLKVRFTNFHMASNSHSHRRAKPSLSKAPS